MKDSINYSALAGEPGQSSLEPGFSPAGQGLPNDRLLAESFLVELERHYQTAYRPGFYEKALQVSSFRLNKALLLNFKRTSHQIIQLRRYQAALELMSDPGLRINQVSAMLDFSDPCYFSRWFKRISGVSPKRYQLAHSIRA